MKLSKFEDGDSNAEIAEAAAGMAWGTLKSYHMARDTQPETTADDLVELATEICVENGGREVSDTDPSGDIAREVLCRLGYVVRCGELGFDAIIRRA